MPEEVIVERIDLGFDNLYYFRWTGTSLGDTITGYASESNDVFGEGGDDVLAAGQQTQDTTSNLFGGDGDDTLKGGLGFDRIRGGTGADLMIGGLGGDSYDVDDPGDVIIEKLAWDSGLGGDAAFISINFSLAGTAVERLILRTGSTAFEGIGNHLDNIIRGNENDNFLDGAKGIDTLYGGDGDDTYILRHRGDRAFEDDRGRPTDGHDTVLAHNSFKLSERIEDIVLQEVNSKTGQPVQGLAAIGNLLDNRVVGNSADNTLQGLQGNDTLTGGARADDFVFNRPLIAANTDLITDFSTGEDHILIRAILTPGIAAGVLSDTAFHLGTEAQTADHRFLYDGQTLWFDADGNDAAAKLAVATFDGTPVLVASDIVLV